ncbi:adenylyltransferase/cytidyltransferase family protein [Butyrivibrio sp. LC3010]|uniref:adenylyltransferase/cytidyltransferase family protein n=1 Tax=Butyrivibrio sp. LC3010 TaxID=1280680 RepID=UPI0003FA7F63|nr:adenylyltransferase/cytidyltransferase family protein [Butyrivibrio sp. LC3010]
MVKAEAKYLNIIELDTARTEISLDEIGGILDKNPTFCIYFYLNGDFYGCVDGSDILKANKAFKDKVSIKRDVITVKSGCYMEALETFYKQPNLKVIPIIADNGHIDGEYQRWDDRIYLKYADEYLGSSCMKEFFSKNSKIAMVRPTGGNLIEKKEFFDKYKVLFQTLGCEVVEISKSEIDDVYNNVKYIIVVDENEGWGIGAHYEAVNRRRYNWYKALTIRRIEDHFNTYNALSCMEEVLVNLANRGATVLSVFCRDNGSDYYRRIDRELNEKYATAGIPRADVILPQWYEDYFDDLYDKEYVDKILGIGFPIIKTSGVHKLIDCKSDVYNVVNGERVTVGQPENYDRRILFFGRCFATGFRVDDRHTIESILQERLNRDGYKALVRNLGCWDSMYGVLNKIVSANIREGDIVIVQTEGITNDNILSLNIADVMEEGDVPSNWMVDSLEHVNHKGYKLLADAIYRKLEGDIALGKKTEETLINGVSYPIIDRYIDRYFSEFDGSRYSEIGSIVMNCNPFTYGHRYLIEEALKRVDYLIVFVVQEDQSVFSFDVRMACVKAGVADLENVLIVPSGDFIISQRTFPEYFLKVDDEDLTSNMEFDIKLFADKIAPRLNIKYRFVGEEISDDVTRQYNETMRRILPRYGIEYVEIPRKKSGNDVISASRVREFLRDEGKIGEVKELVPESTARVMGI